MNFRAPISSDQWFDDEDTARAAARELGLRIEAIQSRVAGDAQLLDHVESIVVVENWLGDRTYQIEVNLRRRAWSRDEWFDLQQRVTQLVDQISEGMGAVISFTAPLA